MLEYVVVDHPLVFPQACFGCISQKGPTLDMQREILGYGRLYLCLRCAKNAARLFGLTDVGKLDQLEANAEQILALEREVAVLVSERDVALQNLASVGRTADASAERVSELHARVAHLESHMRDVAAVSLSLAGAEERS